MTLTDSTEQGTCTLSVTAGSLRRLYKQQSPATPIGEEALARSGRRGVALSQVHISAS